MIVVRTIEDMRAAREQLTRPVGFVPTMGALHAGHRSLVERARRECASLVVSSFVNPLQFGPDEDFERYPRAPEADVALLQGCGVDVLFAPASSEMYPPDAQTYVDPGPLALQLEGERRPGHFRGVATAVLKLFSIVGPQLAYFGRKDAQQLALVRQMVRDLNLPVEIVACPTVREPDGLAFSSRNAYLRPPERLAALQLYDALRTAAALLAAGHPDVPRALEAGRRKLTSLRCDYLAVVDPARFTPLSEAPANADLLVVGAAFAGLTRLIDNVPVRTGPSSAPPIGEAGSSHNSSRPGERVGLR